MDARQHPPPFTLWAISLVMVLLALAAIFVLYKRGDELWSYVKTHWRLLAASLLYPLTATPAKANDRFQNSTAVTLDGSEYQRPAVYFDDNRAVTLDYERQAVDWLRQNALGRGSLATVVEASTPLYRWCSRFSINTGLPSVIGWDWHQKQQRSVLPGQAIDRRIQDNKTIFTSTDVGQVIDLLEEYGVRYIYVGPLERIYYAGTGLDKFDQPNHAWREVYQNAQVKIYEVQG